MRLISFPLSLEPLESVDLADAYNSRLLFHRDLLLVADWNSINETHSIVSLGTSDNGLTERRVLLDAQHSVQVDAWALANDQLLLWDSKSGDLLEYGFKSVEEKN